MPQLDLSWFFINFITAWIAIFLVYLAINNNQWFNENNTKENSVNKTYTTNNWNW
uniref:ATP synthase complex subunit 8 n=1 Tax=Phyllophorella liuwutiensis TaxID=2810320 RepID=A0A890VTD4_9ECHN|nr:ATP synthase F0 subunit 8 [Phyllophorella liuwutiensis]QRI59065.1 ATP synthase F0 subunit 8 [Phyllophorella liuwutiensis]